MILDITRNTFSCYSHIHESEIFYGEIISNSLDLSDHKICLTELAAD